MRVKSKLKKYSKVLVIPDLHIPYHHIDALMFLKEVKRLYKPDLTVCLGDEIDVHAASFHKPNADLLSPGDELLKAIQILKCFVKEFPKLHIIDSNHGSLFIRKIKFNGLPLKILKSHNEILEVPSTWKWSHDLTINSPQGKIYFHHGMSGNETKLSKNLQMNTVEGHFHSKFSITYWANKERYFWAVKSGCLIDDASLAFEYNKTTIDRPILGCTMIIEGQPRLIPMILNSKDRWIGQVVS
jgi:hypothetical protein